MKNTNKKVILIVTAVILVLVAGAVTVILLLQNKQEDGDIQTAPSDVIRTTVPQNESNSETENNGQTTEPVQETSEAMSNGTSGSFSDNLAGKWAPVKAEDTQTGQEESLSFIYGTAFSQYGGSLEFKNDGTFSLWIGAGRDDGSHSGTYTFTEYGIEAVYQNGNTETFTYTIDNGAIQTVKVPQGVYTIYFEKE